MREKLRSAAAVESSPEPQPEEPIGNTPVPGMLPSPAADKADIARAQSRARAAQMRTLPSPVILQISWGMGQEEQAGGTVITNVEDFQLRVVAA